MDEKTKRELAENDPDFKSGAVEHGKKDMIDHQVLPVWASTEPFGYDGSPSDAQAVGGDNAANPAADAGREAAERDRIGPGGD